MTSETNLEALSTSELADMADHHNSAAYAELSDKDLPEDQFRKGLLEILRGEEDRSAEEIEQLTNSVRTAAVAALIVDTGGDLWGEHPKHSKSDWKYEVENGDTMLGYWEWVQCRLEMGEGEDD